MTVTVTVTVTVWLWLIGACNPMVCPIHALYSGIGAEWEPIAGFARGGFSSILMSIDGSRNTTLPTRMDDCAFWAGLQGLPF